SPKGLDTNVGSSTAPWLTLQHADSVVKAGDTVNVAAGTYVGFHEHPSGTATSPITYVGNPQNPASVVIQSAPPDPSNPTQPTDASHDDGDYVTYDGFTLANAGADGILLTGNYDIVENCLIHNNGFGITNPADHGGEGILTGLPGNNDLIENNVIYSNREHGIYISTGADYPTIIGNLLYDNGDPTHGIGCGLQINADGPGWPTTGAVVENNVVYGNLLQGFSLQGCQGGLFENNLIFGNLSGYAILIVKGSINNTFVNNTVTSDVTTGGVTAAVVIGN